MALVTRVSRLFRADLHAVLDRVEEPDVVLRQAIREMEEEFAGDEQRVKLINHEQEQITARAADIEQSLGDIDEELDVCFASEKDELARVLIKRKLEAQRLKKHMSRKADALGQTLTTLETRLKENRARLDSMRQKAELLSEDKTPDYAEDAWGVPDISVQDEDVEVAFLREKQRRARS